MGKNSEDYGQVFLEILKEIEDFRVGHIITTNINFIQSMMISYYDKKLSWKTPLRSSNWPIMKADWRILPAKVMTLLVA